MLSVYLNANVTQGDGGLNLCLVALGIAMRGCKCSAQNLLITIFSVVLLFFNLFLCNSSRIILKEISGINFSLLSWMNKHLVIKQDNNYIRPLIILFYCPIGEL